MAAISGFLSRLVVWLNWCHQFPAFQLFRLAIFGCTTCANVEYTKDKTDEIQDERHGEVSHNDNEMSRQDRVAQLVRCLMTPDVKVPESLKVCEVPLRLSDEDVERIFMDHVPGVKSFLFRGQHGNYSIKFLTSCYRDGFRAFRGTDLHEHLLWLLRLVVHHGEAGGLDASRHLQDVAEAFQECQAVQARAVERAGLQIRGVATNFQGMLTRLAGEYKTVALQMLAV